MRSDRDGPTNPVIPPLVLDMLQRVADAEGVVWKVTAVNVKEKDAEAWFQEFALSPLLHVSVGNKAGKKMVVFEFVTGLRT